MRGVPIKVLKTAFLKQVMDTYKLPELNLDPDPERAVKITDPDRQKDPDPARISHTVYTCLPVSPPPPPRRFGTETKR
jgi:hypothetical protein